MTLVKKPVELPQFKSPPPLKSAVFPLIVLLIIRSVPPSLSIAPPSPPTAWLPLKVLLRIVKSPRLKMPPPLSPVILPPVIVRLDMTSELPV